MEKEVLEDLLSYYRRRRDHEDVLEIVNSYDGSFSEEKKKSCCSFLEEIVEVEDQRYKVNVSEKVVEAIPWKYVSFLALPLVGFLAGMGIIELCDIGSKYGFPVALSCAGGLPFLVYKAHKHFKYDKPRGEIIDKYVGILEEMD